MTHRLEKLTAEQAIFVDALSNWPCALQIRMLGKSRLIWTPRETRDNVEQAGASSGPDLFPDLACRVCCRGQVDVGARGAVSKCHAQLVAHDLPRSMSWRA
jgi:hypothetical protein